MYAIETNGCLGASGERPGASDYDAWLELTYW